MLEDAKMKQVQMDLAKVLIRLLAGDTSIYGGVPAGEIYATLMGTDMQRWELTERLLVRLGYATVKGHLVKLTEEGRVKARQMAELLDKELTKIEAEIKMRDKIQDERETDARRHEADLAKRTFGKKGGVK